MYCTFTPVTAGSKCETWTSVVFSCVCFHVDNCMDRRWSVMTEYIPGAPEGLEAHWEIHQDQLGNVFPVINARWTLRDDGRHNYESMRPLCPFDNVDEWIDHHKQTNKNSVNKKLSSIYTQEASFS